MAFEFIFHITPEKIRVQDPQSGYHQEVSNRVVVRKKDGLALALGETEDKVRAQLGDRYDAQGDGIRSFSLFDADGAELSYEIQALKHFTRLLHRQSAEARPMAHFAAKLVDGFDYSLFIPGYETFPEARRHALEQNLQAHLRLRRLAINGRELQIPMWKRNLEFWLRRILTQALPIVAIVVAYLAMPRAIAASPFTFLAYLMLIMYLFYYGGRIVWMLLVRGLVPHAYRLCMLQGARGRVARTDQLLARAIWGDSLPG